MNHSLARYYGTGGSEKHSSAAETEIGTARALVEYVEGRGLSLSDAPDDAIQGYLDKASSADSVPDLRRKASAALPFVRAWQRGEQDGVAVARAGIKATFDKAWSADQ